MHPMSAQQMADRIEADAVEINHLRNVIQAACSGGLGHMIERWKVLFPDAPVPTVAAPTREFPPMTPELESILGMICFQCMPFVQALRASGQKIATKAEAEQAATIHWMLGHYFRHGEDWRKHASEQMRVWRDAYEQGVRHG